MHWRFLQNWCIMLCYSHNQHLLLLQLFFSLLRDKTHHDPRRSQVKQALDIIPPVLARYKSKGRTPDWLPYIKKWWLEEGSNLPLMIHFWQLVVRHSDVFYPCRYSTS